MKPLYEVKVSNIPAVNKLLYWKNCYGVAKGYINMPLDVIQMYFLAALYFDKWEVNESLIIIFGVLGVVSIFLTGHYLYQKGYVGRDNSIQTEIGSPQLMEILDKVRKIEKNYEKAN